jgi:medium-chain acyl-[acyl-carrier-protein] hydrolase
MSKLVDAIVDAVWPWLDRPFAMFGHSLGAAVAYETACRLEDAGRPPAHLFVAGRRAPQTQATAPPIANLPAAVLAEPTLVAMFLPTLRADLQVNEEYGAAPRPLSCPVSAFGGADDATATAEELDQWAACTRMKFERCLLPGKHFFINDSRTRLLSIIDQRLRPGGSARDNVSSHAGTADALN